MKKTMITPTIAEIKTPREVTCSVCVMNLDNVISGEGSSQESSEGSHLPWIR